MIMTPTLVFPDDEVVKIDKHKDTNGEYDRAPHFSYQFNCTAGSAMRWALCEYTNLKTGEVNHSYFPKGGDINTFYNGDKVGVNELVFNDIAENGHDYQYQYILFQTDPTTIADDTQYGDGVGLYDMYFCRGKVQRAGSSTSFYINKEIGNLKDAYYYERADGSNYLVGGAYMEIGEERRFIEKYDYKTGMVTLKSAFTNTPTVGTEFRIFTNYFIDKPHYVKCRNDPDCIVTAEVNENNSTRPIHCETTYTHPNHVGLKYYKYYLYQTINSNVVYDGTIQDSTNDTTQVNLGKSIGENIVNKCITIEVEPSGTEGHVTEGINGFVSNYNTATGMATIYCPANTQFVKGAKFTVYSETQKLIDESPAIYNFRLNYDFYAMQAGNSYCVVSEIMTLDDKMYHFSKRVSFQGNELGNLVNNFNCLIINNRIAMLSWNTTLSGTAKIFRRNVNEEDYVFLGTTNTKSFFDTTVGNKQTYEYYICYGDYKSYKSEQVSVDKDGWFIYSLTDLGTKYNKKYYAISECWEFITGMTDNDITSNIGLAVHTGTGIKPKTTRTVTDYESGSFSADLLTINCPDGQIVDNIDRVKAWTKFIKGKNDFMLKSHKGDVWIINISDNPTRIYDSTSVLGLTNIKYDWIEVEDINDVIIIR